MHDRMATAHERAAQRYAEAGDTELAVIEHRRAELQRLGRDLEQDHADLLERRERDRPPAG